MNPPYKNIGVEGAKALAATLKESCVTTLYLTSNNIGDKGAKALAFGLEDSITLTKLSCYRAEFFTYS